MIPRNEEIPAKVFSTGKKLKFKLKEENKGKLFHFLRNKLYSDKLAAVIREYSTNAADEHMECDQSKPFQIHLPTELSPVLRIKDFGRGLSLEEIDNVYISMVESSKTDSDLLNGCMGLGCKSGFCYGDSFEIISRHNGIKIHGLAYLDESFVGEMVILEEKEIGESEQNGIEVVIGIKPEDFHRTKETAIKIASAFEFSPEIYENGKKVEFVNIFPRSNIEVAGKGNSFVFSGNVKYPLDLDKLKFKIGEIVSGKTSFNIVAPIGSIDFTPSRESLEYTEHTLENLSKVINESIEKIKKEVLSALSPRKKYECENIKSAVMAIKASRILSKKTSCARLLRLQKAIRTLGLLKKIPSYFVVPVEAKMFVVNRNSGVKVCAKKTIPVGNIKIINYSEVASNGKSILFSKSKKTLKQTEGVFQKAQNILDLEKEISHVVVVSAHSWLLESIFSKSMIIPFQEGDFVPKEETGEKFHAICCVNNLLWKMPNGKKLATKKLFLKRSMPISWWKSLVAIDINKAEIPVEPVLCDSIDFNMRTHKSEKISNLCGAGAIMLYPALRTVSIEVEAKKNQISTLNKVVAERRPKNIIFAPKWLSHLFALAKEGVVKLPKKYRNFYCVNICDPIHTKETKGKNQKIINYFAEKYPLLSYLNPDAPLYIIKAALNIHGNKKFYSKHS